MEREALIQWICVRRAHRDARPVDPSTPLSIHDEGGWSYCPSGASDDHLWYHTGGITHAALGRFVWPSEEEAKKDRSAPHRP